MGDDENTNLRMAESVMKAAECDLKILNIADIASVPKAYFIGGGTEGKSGENIGKMIHYMGDQIAKANGCGAGRAYLLDFCNNKSMRSFERV